MTAAYDLAINWKGDTKGYRVTPNDGVAFTTESEEAYVHATDRMNVTTSTARVTFSGLTEDLKGHIYDVGTRYQEDQFTATTEALARYAGCKCFNPQDIMIEIEHQKDVKIPIPTTRTDINEDVEKLLPGKEIYAYVNKIYQH